MIHTGHHLTTLNKKGNELAPMVIAHKSAATRYRISSFYVFPQATMSAVIAVGFLPQATYIPQHNANNRLLKALKIIGLSQSAPISASWKS
jgi:hypothetical protein